MMQYLLLPVAVAVWCLIGLLVFIGVREIIKLKPRSTTAEHRKKAEENTRVVEKNAAMRSHYLTGASYSGKNAILYVGTTKGMFPQAWERRATHLRPRVEPWAAFGKEAPYKDVIPRLPIIDDKATQTYERNEAEQLEREDDTKRKAKPMQSVPEMMFPGKDSYEPNSMILVLDRHRKHARGSARQHSNRRWKRA